MALDHLQGLADLGVEFLKRRYFVASLASEPCSRATAVSRGGIGQHLGIDELPFQFFEASEFFVERIGHGKDERSRQPLTTSTGLAGDSGRRLRLATSQEIGDWSRLLRAVRLDAASAASAWAAAFLPRLRLA